MTVVICCCFKEVRSNDSSEESSELSKTRWLMSQWPVRKVTALLHRIIPSEDTIYRHRSCKDESKVEKNKKLIKKFQRIFQNFADEITAINYKEI
ncbi:hypothetical protein GJ496_005409 [Pomphorhynchus laevis]|nr:hypothetical protein GJ496_005409 [Pomphorhynchus laevis]